MANIKNKFNFIFLSLFIFGVHTQAKTQFLEGKVLNINEKGIKIPLVGATLRWQNSSDGGITDFEGYFKIKKNPENHQLILSLIGYLSDTLMVHTNDFQEINLNESKTDLEGVIIRGNSSVLDKLNPIQAEIITSLALKKAACCNLSESFETNASVSVSYADAITGSKQIQMLGLSGSYIQINTENIPNIRGLNTTYGLNYTPGTWVNSIDIGKGAGSVVNGYESMSGSINVELIKPENADKLFINSYLNSQGRGELNVHLADTLSKKWSVGLLTHASSQKGKVDGNDDGFLDIPLYTQYNLINRWKYQSEKFSTQFGVKFLDENRVGGQSIFDPKTDKNTSKAYGFGSKTKRFELFGKVAMLFPNLPYKGLGLIINGLAHDNQSYFGFKNYSGNEQSIYSNLIFQNIISNTNHTYRTGASILVDNYDESFTGQQYVRNEIVPGIFGEYSFTIPEKFNLLLGSRVDFHNIYGTKFTPRLHLKFDLDNKSQLRANIGTGWRVPNIFAENFGYFVNSRAIFILENIKPETARNIGVSFNRDFNIFDKKGSIILDFYRTDFQNQLIVDMENTAQVLFYNQRGKSFSNSFQAEVNLNPKERFDLKVAYRLFDVKSDFLSQNGTMTLLAKQFINKDRVLFNAAYATKWNKWKYDITLQWNGKRRIPNTEPGHTHAIDSPQIFAPAYTNLNAQITKVYKNWEIYLGGENLTNFKQKAPIIAAKDPFDKDFDASMVWGPVAGRMVYSGVRWKMGERD
jgi:outer membrane receptor for ferrienterochelin and colicins